MSEPILITGADGFAGGHLRAELGEAAVAAESDVLDLDAFRREVRAARPGAVVHLAALSSAGESWSAPTETWHVNVVGTANVLEAVRHEAEGARVVVVSTGEVYGRAEKVPTSEGAAVAPISPYAASKAAAEIAAAQAAFAGLDVVVARAFQHEGPGRDERFAVGSWTHQIAELEQAGGGTLKVGDLSARRDITDVRDVCRAYRLLLDSSVPPETYNVASGRAVSMEEVLQLLVGLARCPVEVEPDPDRFRPAELPVVCGDSSRLRSATGWEPQIPLEQTLADALDYARNAVSKRAAQT
jgi:GDP-4-dehydro-6-deoxy-D-mannose reductase